MKLTCITVALLSMGIAASAQTVPQANPGTWISPTHPSPPGKAPGMKVQLLSQTAASKTYAVIFYKGDEAYSGLVDFAWQYHITAAHFTAIGALVSADLAWFDPTHKMYKEIPIKSQVEVLSMVGDIALYNGKPVVHTHMVVGFPDGTTRGGHVLEAHVNPTLEVMVTVEPATMERRFDPATDLSLIDPALHQ